MLDDILLMVVCVCVCVSCNALWVMLQKRYKVPEKLLRSLLTLHWDTRGAVHAYDKVSKKFLIKNGVWQDDVLAPTLFNFFTDAVISMATANTQAVG